MEREVIKKILREIDTSVSSGVYNGPMELGLKKWEDNQLKPYVNFVDNEFNHDKKQKTLKNNKKTIIGFTDKKNKVDSYDAHTVNETINKILKESEWDWTQENQVDVPLQDIVDWCDNNGPQIFEWIQKIKEFNKHSPQIKWDGNDSEFGDENKMIALSVKGIGDELRNIYASFETIKGEIDYIQNPEKYND
jgi:hypothetical protein